MPANINEFLTQFKDTELARQYNYEVKFFPTTSVLWTAVGSSIFGKILQAYILLKGQEYRFKSESAEFPQRSFGLVEQKIYGVSEKYPISNAYDFLRVNFICSDDMSEKYFFDLWMEVISPATPLAIIGSEVGSLASAAGIDLGLGTRYDFQYRDNYTSTIVITQFDVTGKPTYEIVLIDAYPTTVAQLPLSWNSNDVHRLTVQFSYKYFTINPLVGTGVNPFATSDRSTLSKILDPLNIAKGNPLTD